MKKKLFLCLCLSAFTASLLTTFQWERDARAEWHQRALDLQALRYDADETALLR
jgi:hypothetical protein